MLRLQWQTLSDGVYIADNACGDLERERDCLVVMDPEEFQVLQGLRGLRATKSRSEALGTLGKTEHRACVVSQEFKEGLCATTSGDLICVFFSLSLRCRFFRDTLTSEAASVGY